MAERAYNESDLEEELHRLYEEGARLGYRANRFYQLFTPKCKRYVEVSRRFDA